MRCARSSLGCSIAIRPRLRWTRKPGRKLRADLDRHLKQMGLHPPKWAKDIPEPFWERYFDLMPIHEKLRTRDAPTTRNYLRVTMINIHDELTKRMDTAAVIGALSAPQKTPL